MGHRGAVVSEDKRQGTLERWIRLPERLINAMRGKPPKPKVPQLEEPLMPQRDGMVLLVHRSTGELDEVPDGESSGAKRARQIRYIQGWDRVYPKPKEVYDLTDEEEDAFLSEEHQFTDCGIKHRKETALRRCVLQRGDPATGCPVRHTKVSTLYQCAVASERRQP